jgi:hypothetical protein
MKNKFLFYLIFSMFPMFNLAFGQQNKEQCKDPWKDVSWYKAINNEIFDYKQLLVWHKCPALFTENGKCVPANTLPSENFDNAKKIPLWAPNANWRLPTIGELYRVVAKKCDYQFPSELIELPPVPLWTSTIYQNGYMKIGESGDVFNDKKNDIAWTIYTRDFSIKDMLLYKNEISENLEKISDNDISTLYKKNMIKLTKTEIFFESEMSRIQSGDQCDGEINQLMLSLSCTMRNGTSYKNKNKIDCLGKKRKAYVCISETVDASNSNLNGNTVRVDLEIKDESIKQTAYPIYKGGTLMPYRIESTFSIVR